MSITNKLKLTKPSQIEKYNIDVMNANMDKIDGIFDLIYPVGSIYMSVNPTNPATLFGGEWEAWGNGRVPVGIDTSQTEFNTVEKTGGDKLLQSHNHTASSSNSGGHTPSGSIIGAGGHSHSGTTGEAGQHSHYIPNGRSPQNSGSPPKFESWPTATSTARDHYTDAAGSHTHSFTTSSVGDHSHTLNMNAVSAHSHTITVNNTGGGNSGNLQPYIVCYMWKRVN